MHAARRSRRSARSSTIDPGGSAAETYASAVDDDKTARQLPTHGASRALPTWERPYLTTIGMVAATVGFVDGIASMLKRHETPCPDGTFFPEGTKDFTCYSHPHLAAGMGLCAIAVMLGVVILMLGTKVTRSEW